MLEHKRNGVRPVARLADATISTFELNFVKLLSFVLVSVREQFVKFDIYLLSACMSFAKRAILLA